MSSPFMKDSIPHFCADANNKRAVFIETARLLKNYSRMLEVM